MSDRPKTAAEFACLDDVLRAAADMSTIVETEMRVDSDNPRIDMYSLADGRRAVVYSDTAVLEIEIWDNETSAAKSAAAIIHSLNRAADCSHWFCTSRTDCSDMGEDFRVCEASQVRDDVAELVALLEEGASAGRATDGSGE